MKLKEFFFTAFYSGYFPVMPGTAGTVIGMALYFAGYFIAGAHSCALNCAAVIILIYPVKYLCDEGEKFFGRIDPPEVVIDEVLGYWVALLFHPFSIKLAIAGFIIFRIMDIMKPYPIKDLQNFKGGLGIMIDDVAAGIYTNIILTLFILISGYTGFHLFY